MAQIPKLSANGTDPKLSANRTNPKLSANDINPQIKCLWHKSPNDRSANGIKLHNRKIKFKCHKPQNEVQMTHIPIKCKWQKIT
jgi:hypothetical protein